MRCAEQRSGAPSARLGEYTGLRGIASLWVLASHVFLFAGIALGAGLYLITRSYIAVEIFFGLSVFLLLRSLDKNPDKNRYFARRVKRIWPLYFAVCIASFILFDRDVLTFAENVSFTGVYLPGALVGPYWILWSLQIEEAMYVTFPWIHALKPSAQTTVAIGMIVVSVLTAGLRYAPTGMVVSYLVVNVHQLPLIWFGSYGAGILAYRGLSCSVTLATALAAVSAIPQVPFALTVILSFPLVIALLNHPPRWMAHSVTTSAGDVSYALYATQVLWFDALGWIGAIGVLVTSPIIEKASTLKTTPEAPLKGGTP